MIILTDEYLQHTAAMIRGMLPVAPTHLTGFAALNKAILAPHDTIHSVLKAVGKGLSYSVFNFNQRCVPDQYIYYRQRR